MTIFQPTQNPGLPGDSGMTTRPTLHGTFGMVASTHWLASQSAMAVLEGGGNAFDAVVAGCFVLHVAEPHMNGAGGEMPAIFSVRGGSPIVLCGQGPAPEAASAARLRDLGLDLIPGSGPVAAVVPGAVDALLLLLRDYGTRSVRDTLGYAVWYARHGIPLYADVCAKIATVQQLFEEHWPTSAELWLPGGTPPQPGELHRNSAYADTLERLITQSEAAGASREAQIDAARSAWKEGFVADAVDKFQRQPFMDSSGGDHCGLVTAADMARFSATYEQPLTTRFCDWMIAKTGPWAQGPALLQTLNLLSAAASDFGEMDPSSADGIHLVAEAMKLSFADREAWYGDSRDVPISDLLSADYATARAALITATASAELRPGSPGGREPRIARLAATAVARGSRPGWTGDPAVSAGLGEAKGDTCHIDVADRWGNLISATPSGGWLHGSPVIPGLGFSMTTRLQMFWLEEGLASSLAPGRRPRTTLTPTMVMRDDGIPVLACGTPGGDQQDQWQLGFLLRHLCGGMGIQEAIDAPAWHTTSFPSSFFPRGADAAGLVIEDRIGLGTRADLAARGHAVTVAAGWSLGRVCAVGRDPESGVLTAGANPRGMHAYAVGR
jgi:gamma-glutamyltranspeptidase / glutathione hydrolase